MNMDSRVGSDADIRSRWHKMHVDERTKQALSEVIQKEWELSDCLNIDYNHATPLTVPESEFKAIKKETTRLYVNCYGVLNPIIDTLGEKTLGILMFDTQGCLLHIFCTESFRTWTGARHIKVGTRWDMNTIGANIFSLGMKSKKVAAMHAEENYSSFLIEGAYYFSQIEYDNKELCGSIVLVVPENRRNPQFLSLVRSIARSVELQFFWFGMLDAYGEIREYGLMNLDQTNNQNRIVTMSPEIFKMLQIPYQNFYFERLEQFIDPPPSNREFWNIINNNLVVLDKTLKISAGGKTSIFSISTTPFKGNTFNMTGITIAWNSMNRINKLITKYTANTAHYTFRDIVGDSDTIKILLERAKSAASTDGNILLLGESGVGKDILAQAIHNASRRSKRPFVAINCAAFSKELIASELFGYVGGAFTGAKKEGSMGKFELANKGTLFLDEIGDMPLDLQAILLRVLEERAFRKVGGIDTIYTDVRIIAATNRNITERIRQGLFREDLFYRIGVVRLTMPPLRERGDDVVLLANHFINQICQRLNKPLVSLTKDGINLLVNYRWPGNIRELQNLLEGIISTTNNTYIDASLIRLYQVELDPPSKSSPMMGSAPEEDLIYDERAEIVKAMRICRNNKTKAAEYLGMSRKTLYRRLKEYRLM